MAEATEVQGADRDMTMAAATAVTALVEAMEARVEATEARVVVLVEATVVLVEALVVRVAGTDMTMEEAMAESQEEITATADQVGMALADMALAAMVPEAATTTADASSPPLGSCCGLVSHG
ncbi:uncharacterized protein LOC115686314 isoform X2 [Syzygium oleosum]|nr:uncharacterized protein LOC115686314 isoform X2 [Syzygium oleosum]